ncbi:MAG: LytTR family DNA-binding domain-containing protein [Lachnospiraceae bacterium]|nr:LytTR family DNA-binding domain-containing protein [Ruminococcus sp.]MCM1276812.1 LytTR family DNA-binding domain-containing protein [Lachnospiraceae bacterium]
MIKMIKIAVCDDDELFITETLKRAVSIAVKSSDISPEIRFFLDGTLLLNRFQNGEYYDIIILDIDMPKINGKELAAKLREMDMSFFLVFITSYPNELANTVPYRINAFIPKNGDVNKYGEELARVFSEYQRIKPEREIIEINRNGESTFLTIPLNSIYWFKFSEKIIAMRTISDEYILSEKTFTKITEKYKKMGFFEVHRSTLVNLRKIHSIGETSITLDNGEQLPLSRRKRKDLLEAMAGNIMREVS